MAEAVHSQTIGDYAVTTIVSGQYRENGYVIVHAPSRAALIIDPGGRAEDFESVVGDNRVVGLVLTHGHFDHVGAARPLCQRYGIACQLDRKDHKLTKQATLWGLKWENAKIRVPQPMELFDAPTRLALNSAFELDVLPTPGHTEGSVSFFLPGMAFAGDLIFRELVGPTVYPGSDRAALITSVEAFLTRAAPETIIFSGHGRPWSAREALAWWRALPGDPPSMKLFGEPAEGATKQSAS